MKRWIIAGVVSLAGLLSAPALLWAESDATAPTASATLAVKKLNVNGMTCFGCVQAVEAALKKVAGVSQAEVSLKENEAVVEYDPAQVDPEILVAAVTDAGFEAEITEADAPQTATTQEPEGAPN